MRKCQAISEILKPAEVTAVSVSSTTDTATLVSEMADKLPVQATRAMAILLTYLKEFGLERRFLSRAAVLHKERRKQSRQQPASTSTKDREVPPSFLIPFASIATMRLDGHTLVNLDIVSTAGQQHSKFRAPAKGANARTKSAPVQPTSQTSPLVPAEERVPPTALLRMLDYTCV